MNIRELAKIANVSVATISRCLSNPEKLAPATRERIQAIIEEYGYAPNPNAKSLSTGSTATVGIIVPHIRNEYFTQLIDGAHEVLQANGYKMMVYTTNYDIEFWKNLELRSVDGLLVSGISFQKSIPETLDKLSVPAVVIDHTEALEGSEKYSNVYVQDDVGVTKALDYLYREGNRRFGILTGPAEDHSIQAKRRRHAAEAFFEKHPDALYVMEYGHYTDYEVITAAAEKLIESDIRPTALFAFSDHMALGAHRVILKKRYRMPEEIELLGFDDTPISECFTPSLSTVSAPNKKLGGTAAEMLLKAIGNSEDYEVEHLLYPVKLKLRETTRNLVEAEEMDA